MGRYSPEPWRSGHYSVVRMRLMLFALADCTRTSSKMIDRLSNTNPAWKEFAYAIRLTAQTRHSRHACLRHAGKGADDDTASG
jgi:hypothetical protein